MHFLREQDFAALNYVKLNAGAIVLMQSVIPVPRVLSDFVLKYKYSLLNLT